MSFSVPCENWALPCYNMYIKSVHIRDILTRMQVTYTKARENLASLLDRAVNDREVIVIERRGKQDVALIAADDLASLIETAYLLRSPLNAKRLLDALEWSRAQDRNSVEAKDTEQAIAQLLQELGIGEEKES